VVLDATGIPLSTATLVQAEPQLAAGNGQWLVAFTDGRNGNNDLYATRVLATGMVLDNAGLNVCVCSEPRAVVRGGQRRHELPRVWQDFRFLGASIFGIRVDSTGLALGAPFVISAAIGSEATPAVAWDGAQYVAVWADLRAGNSDIYAARVSPAGVLLDSTRHSSLHRSLQRDRPSHCVGWNPELHRLAGRSRRRGNG